MIFLAVIAIGEPRATADTPVDPGIRARVLLCQSQYGVCWWLTTTTPIIQLGQPATLSLWLGNTTSNPIESCVGGLKVQVTDLSGAQLPLRTPPKSERQAPCLLAPHTPRQFVVRLNDFVAFPSNGLYNVRVILTVLVAPGRTKTIESSPVFGITVIPTPPPTPFIVPSPPNEPILTIGEPGGPLGEVAFGAVQHGVKFSMTPTYMITNRSQVPEVELWIGNLSPNNVDVCVSDFVHTLTFDVVDAGGGTRSSACDPTHGCDATWPLRAAA